MPKSYSGFIVLLDEDALGKLLDSIVSQGQSDDFPLNIDHSEVRTESRNSSELRYSKTVFTLALSAADIDAKDSEIFLLSFDGTNLTYAALAKKGRRIATGKNSIRLTRVVEFPPISIQILKDSLESRLQPHITYSSERGGHRVPPATWQAVLKILQTKSPLAFEAIDQLLALRNFESKPKRSPAYEIVAEEKDAVSLSLEFSGFDRNRELLSWKPTRGDDPAPFLEGMTPSNLLEDQMIGYDSNVFGDWVRTLSHQINAVEFRRSDARLTVLNVNRTPIEKTLGVDLIYYHHRYKSFVMVQYKRLKASENNEPVFRLSEKNYAEEIARMRSFMEIHGDADLSGMPLEAYRLHDIPFYFKLCPNSAFDPNEPALLKGMYIPLDYWALLETSESTLGSQGGRQVSYKNAGRFLSNSQFTSLVGSGYVGSRLSTTDAISTYIRECYESGKSVILADYRPAIRGLGKAQSLEHGSSGTFVDWPDQ